MHINWSAKYKYINTSDGEPHAARPQGWSCIDVERHPMTDVTFCTPSSHLAAVEFGLDMDFSIIRQRLRAALDTRFSAFVRCRMQFSARGVRQAGVLGLILFSISISVWKEISAHGWKYNYNPRNTRLIYSRQYMGASSVHPGHTDWMEGVIRCRRFFIKTILTGASRGARQSDNITDLRAAASTTSATTTVVTTTSTSTQPTQPSTSIQPTQPSYCYVMFYILWATQMILPRPVL